MARARLARGLPEPSRPTTAAPASPSGRRRGYPPASVAATSSWKARTIGSESVDRGERDAAVGHRDHQLALPGWWRVLPPLGGQRKSEDRAPNGSRSCAGSDVPSTLPDRTDGHVATHVVDAGHGRGTSARWRALHGRRDMRRSPRTPTGAAPGAGLAARAATRAEGRPGFEHDVSGPAAERLAPTPPRDGGLLPTRPRNPTAASRPSSPPPSSWRSRAAPP